MSLAKSFMHHHTSIELLCIHNYDVYTKLLSQEFGSTPLVAACDENHPKVVTVLIENGAVVDSTDKVFQNSVVSKFAYSAVFLFTQKGMSALHFASDAGNTDVVNLLLKYHAQLEIKNNVSFSDHTSLAVLDCVCILV